MGKFCSSIFLLAVVVSCALLPSCGSGSPTTISNEIPPTGVTISPSPVVSLQVGQIQAFTGGPTGHTFDYESSNPAVLTIAANGQACAGTWNSLTSPQVCTPGQPGTAVVTANAQGVSSPEVMVYVHEPITNITISKVAGQPPTVSDTCLSKGAVHGPESWLFEANAFSGTTDITSTVGPFTWQQLTPAGSAAIVGLTAPPNGTQGCLLGQGQCLNQELITASTPGVVEVYASASGFSSQPISIETCRVKSISIAAAGNVPSNTSFLVTSGTSTTLNATVTDFAGQTITGVPLTWSSSNPTSANTAATGSSTSVYGSTNSVSTATAGGGNIIASCTPPTCNAGFSPSLPIYPQAAFSFLVQPSGTATATSPTVYATTTACNDPIANPGNASCIANVVPVTKATSTSAFTAGAPTSLPALPNTLLIDNNPNATTAYLGVDSTRFGQQGLMVFTASAVTQATNVPGKVLAISPDHSSIITSDTVDSPNQVFVCDGCSGTSRTITTLTITGATAAAFSPDSLKAYILAGNTLYVYSKADPLQTIPLSGTANDVAFHPEGGFAYLAGPATSISPYRVCDNSPISSANLSTTNPPLMIRALPDGSSFLALEPPNIDIISTTLPPGPPVLCTGTLTDTLTSFGLGQGSFIPTQFFLSPNGLTAYILGETSAGPPPSRLPFIITFNVTTQASSLLSLSDNAIPLSAALAPDGSLLFVGADDGTLHVIDTTSGLDTQQVTFLFPENALCNGPGNPATQVSLTQVRITAASESSSNTTYSYSLISGPALKIGQSITISGMLQGGNNGIYTIAALGTDASGNPTFTVSNTNGVDATGQSGLGVVPIPCNPDLIVTKP